MCVCLWSSEVDNRGLPGWLWKLILWGRVSQSNLELEDMAGLTGWIPMAAFKGWDHRWVPHLLSICPSSGAPISGPLASAPSFNYWASSYLALPHPHDASFHFNNGPLSYFPVNQNSLFHHGNVNLLCWILSSFVRKSEICLPIC